MCNTKFEILFQQKWKKWNASVADDKVILKRIALNIIKVCCFGSDYGLSNCGAMCGVTLVVIGSTFELYIFLCYYPGQQFIGSPTKSPGNPGMFGSPLNYPLHVGNLPSHNPFLHLGASPLMHNRGHGAPNIVYAKRWDENLLIANNTFL